MDEQTDILAALNKDEAVCFIADRYRITPDELLHHFFVLENCHSGEENTDSTFLLEDNEMEILKGLINTIIHK